MSLAAVDLPFIRILRLLRTLRPLRFISHNVNLKIVVIALLESLGGIFNVVIVVFLVWIMFAILGVSLLRGRMGYCDSFNPEVGKFGVPRNECFGKWRNYDTNFENVYQAMMTLFVVSSLEGWPEIMYEAIDSATEDQGPTRGNSPAFAIYYILFILIGSFFFVNLFVGVIFYEFNKARKNEEKKNSFFRTPEQEKWITICKMILKQKPKDVTPYAPKNRFSKFVRRVIEGKWFDPIIMICIVLNIILMAMAFEGSSQKY
mmetsp:Transcript_23808/g.20742  ORF Transcript_23808/g.20742 Transcript_23808/m.20742 type:complete len:260 (+) Transcript_23808:400-1179(+)